MALSTSSRPLLVPAADVLAKNMRALDAARLPPAAATAEHAPPGSGTRRALIGLGQATERKNRRQKSQILFRRAKPSTSPLTAFIARLTAPKEKQKSIEPTQKISTLDKIAVKVGPPLEKAAKATTRLPDPTWILLALVASFIPIIELRPRWVAHWAVKALLIILVLVVVVLAVVWKKAELFRMMKEGEWIWSHPVERQMDQLEADIVKREVHLKNAEDELQKNRAKLDALRKELAKDPLAKDPDAILVPSRKAALMIAAGALGAGFDEEAAQVVEQKRKEESVKKSREEWRQRTEEVEGETEQTMESLKLMADHAATAYTKRTKELKTRNSVGSSGVLGKRAEQIMNLRKGIKRDEQADDASENMSRMSERSVATSQASTASKRKLGLFRRKKRQDTREGTRMSDAVGLDARGES